MYELRRLSGGPLALTREHEAIARPRHAEVAWDAFDATAYEPVDLERAATLWRTRAVQEMHSLALFTEICGKLQVLGAPLDFGTLSNAGYALAFFDGMREDVVPGLVSIGLPEAEAAYADLLQGSR